MAATGLDVYEEALAAGTARLTARWGDGHAFELPVDRWLGEVRASDEGVLRRARGPVIDVGCGPGRHLVALRRRGIPALGLDISAAAVRLARRRGGTAVRASVFEWQGRARTALLLDGNVGIGGDPVALLRHVAGLLETRGGLALVELDPPEVVDRRGMVRLEDGRRRSDPFPWARASVDNVGALADDAGFDVDEVWTSERRWFAALGVNR